MAALSLEETRRWLLNLLPPGADKLYDLTSAGDVYKLFDGFAQAFKQFGHDLLETLRAEIFPSSAVQKLPDWEKAIGLTASYFATNGATAQRQSGILAKLREFGSFTPYLVRAVVAPLLGYADFTQLRVMETNRYAFTNLHTYQDSPLDGQGAIPANGSVTRSIYVPDGGNASRAGAKLTLGLIHPAVQGLTITLTAPSGKSKTWRNIGQGAATYGHTWLLYAPEFARTQCNVRWTLMVTDSSDNSGSLLAWWLFVEGVGSNLPGPAGPGAGGLAGDIFDWGVVIDPALAGAVRPPDYSGARFAINRIKHAHTNGHLIRSIAPQPDSALAIPDQFVPG
jgi:uncharacterized protein YmfQ (DUF2313 family)